MSGPRYDRILASTALALILAGPLGASVAAQETGKLANAPTVATQSAPPSAESTPTTPPSDAAKDAVTPAAAPVSR